MSKTRILAVLLTIPLFQVRGQGVDSNDVVSIYFVTHPGGCHDTAHYTLTDSEKESISRILKSPATLKSAVNTCIMDGLISSISYEKADKKYSALILNAYESQASIRPQDLLLHLMSGMAPGSVP